jgi:glycerol kinase
MVEAGTPQERVVLALYQDTQGSTALVMDAAGRLLGRSYAMVTQHRPQPGWAEYDPYEIWHRSWQAIEQACKAAGVGRGELVAVGVTAQRGTAVVWERASGRPIGPAISWNCLRTAETCQELRASGYEEMLRQHCGRPLDTSAAGPKLQWLLTNVPGLRRRAQNGEVCCGTVDSWLLWNMTGGATHATDRTQAAHTLLYNLRTGDWDEDLLDLLGIPRASLPEVQASGHSYGSLREGSTPITALCADQQAGLFGQACFQPGVLKATCGRDAVALMEIGSEPVDTAGQLRTVPVPGLDGEPPGFALEGQILAAGVVMEWLRDELALIPTVADSEVLAQQARNSSGVYVIPAFLGLGAPYWSPQVRGTIVGLTPTTSRAQLVRAALEGVVYRLRDVVEAMARWAGHGTSEVRADGGVAANNFILQFLADLLGVPVRRGRTIQAAPSGVAFLAGLQAGLWASREQIAEHWPEDRRFEPSLDEHTRQLLYQGWQEAVQRVLAYAYSKEQEHR